jgi:hypothetical protein
MKTTERLGYDDTPVLPGSKYRVHDKARPWPPVITPGTAWGHAPSDATVLFDGTNLWQWKSARDDGEARWRVTDGYMEVAPGTGNIETREHFGDCQIHLEWAAPEKVESESQGRGNSGVFLMGRYEIQVLDNYDNPTYADGMAGAVYGEFPPLVNACRKPGVWQTYDLVWLGPRFKGETLVRPAVVTLFHNGVLVQHARELIGPTTHRTIAPYAPHSHTGPLLLQDHGNLVRFRNIWYRPLRDAEAG